MPAKLAIPTSLLLILISAGFLADLISDNVTQVIAKGPEYQQTFWQRIDEVSSWLTELTPNETPLELGDKVRGLLEEGYINQILTAAGNSLRGLLANTGLILIYLMFLMLERRTFASKLDALFPDSKKKDRVSAAFDQVRKRVETYIGIKTFNSALTGLLSYAVLKYAGLDFASFWGVIIFVLNFIPTVGSLIATALPVMLAMLQFGFDPINKFLTVLIGVGVIQFSIGNALEPKLMGGSLNLSPLVILFSLALWGSLWGIPGMLLCVPFTVIAAIVAKEIPEARPLAIVLSGDGRIGDEDDDEEK